MRNGMFSPPRSPISAMRKKSSGTTRVASPARNALDWHRRSLYGEPLDAFVFAGAGLIISAVLWNLRAETVRPTRLRADPG